MSRKYIQAIAWIWMIVVGGLLIVLPHGPIVCIVCGGPGTISIGVITAVLGIAGFLTAGANPASGREVGRTGM